MANDSRRLGNLSTSPICAKYFRSRSSAAAFINTGMSGVDHAAIAKSTHLLQHFVRDRNDPTFPTSTDDAAPLTQ
jgi:hypothetical protein